MSISAAALATVLFVEASMLGAFQVRVPRTECYAMAFRTATAALQPSAEYFPTRLVLLPGLDTGAVRADAQLPAVRRYWWAASRFAQWHGIGGDSVELRFSNGFADVVIRARRADSRLDGTAEFREGHALRGHGAGPRRAGDASAPFAGGADPFTMRVTGALETCPVTVEDPRLRVASASERSRATDARRVTAFLREM